MKMPPIDALETFSGGVTFTVEVPIRNLWRARLGLWLVRLAALVLRCPITIDERPRDDR